MVVAVLTLVVLKAVVVLASSDVVVPRDVLVSLRVVVGPGLVVGVDLVEVKSGLVAVVVGRFVEVSNSDVVVVDLNGAVVEVVDCDVGPGCIGAC